MGILDTLASLPPEQAQGLLATGLGILANNTGHYGAFGPAVGAGGLTGLSNLQQQTQQKRQYGLQTRGLDISEAYKTMQEKLLQEQINKQQQAIENQRRIAGYLSPEAPLQGQPQSQPQPQTQSPPSQSMGTQDGQITAPTVEVTASPLVDYQGMAQKTRQQAMQIMPLDSGLGNHLLESADRLEKLGVEKTPKPLTQMLPVSDTHEQLHQYNQQADRWEPVRNTAQRPIFNPQPLVRIGMQQETAESAKVGSGFGEEYNTIQKAGFNASSKINNLNRINQLLEGVDTGKLTPAATNIAAYAASAGFNIDPKLGNKQAAEALAGEIALQLRNPSGGAGMPGSLSDNDLRFLRSMTPGIEKSPEGRKLIVETGMKLAKRDQEVAKIVRDYRKANGHMDEGVYDELAKFSAEHPLFAESPSTKFQGNTWTPDKERRLRELEQKHAQ